MLSNPNFGLEIPSRGYFSGFEGKSGQILRRALQNPPVNLIGSRHDNKESLHELEEVLALS
jgi:hypothetical protein